MNKIDANKTNGLDIRKDIFSKDATILRTKRLYLLDMDGTIYEEERLFDGTLRLLDLINEMGGNYVFITNNSSKSVVDYLAKVKKMGIEADKDSFFTSAQATILYIKKNHLNKTVYCMGTKSLVQELCDSGINTVTDTTDDVGVVLVGFDTELTSEKLRKTCELLKRDLPYIATNPDLTCPVSFGFIPDCGAICEMISHATGKMPLFIGKPAPTMVDFVMDKFGYSKEDTVVIGDRLYTDIASGLNADVTAVCVLTGEATVDDIKTGDIKPTFTFNSVDEIRNILEI
jgi:HAD superfamily hydrolase (TIGR01450 family)